MPSIKSTDTTTISPPVFSKRDWFLSMMYCSVSLLSTSASSAT
ncbi:Uncharacterised protein [Flavonifractor plautii]|uniref:Uncharacterized protein n=1 Tax=Flavonifractor plautii TaxID=292800 RepID=A0A174VW73_FLAPL|nr:Uncharacterised protein [Flavonifractor plautii]